MINVERLMAHVRARPQELAQLKKQGAKVIGCVPNGVMPEELLHASGAPVVGLIRGGDHEAVIKSEVCLQRFVDTFCRAHIGYRLLGTEPLYQLPDVLAVAYTDHNMAAIGETWQNFTDVPVLKLDVPKYHRASHALEYYHKGLQSLKQRLEMFVGHAITGEDISRQIAVSNRIRRLLREISLSRRPAGPAISGSDFIRLNHASFTADRAVLLECLEEVARAVTESKTEAIKGPRIMLTGSTLADGDSKVVNLLEKHGAAIVIEEFTEGINDYWAEVDESGDPLAAIAGRYLQRRLPPPFFKHVTRERFDFLTGLVDDFRVDGVVWYELLYRDAHDREAVLFRQLMDTKGVPFLKLNSDYDAAETGAMETRLEAFLESIAQRKRHV